MNSVFVNRLVGTVIVLVAAIVFIPNILDGENLFGMNWTSIVVVDDNLNSRFAYQSMDLMIY